MIIHQTIAIGYMNIHDNDVRPEILLLYSAAENINTLAMIVLPYLSIPFTFKRKLNL